MKRAFWLTVIAAVVCGVAAGLAGEARELPPGTARALLLSLLVFVVFEWLSHLVGSRIWKVRNCRADRAGWAALSSAGIWVALLAVVPFWLRVFGVRPDGASGVAIITGAVALALGARLWFLREIYEVDFGRAASLWTATRGAAVAMAFLAFAVYAAFVAVGPGIANLRLSAAPRPSARSAVTVRAAEAFDSEALPD